jgi:Glycosyl transferases group 1
MKKVCLFNFPKMDDFHGYSIECLDPFPYFEKNNKWGISELVMGGWNKFSKFRNLAFAEGLDRMYRQKDPGYMRFLSDFVDKYRNFDLVVLSTYNPVHPEILFHELKKPVKVLGFIDDPFSSYVRGIPYLWAFDGAFYISPSYDEKTYSQDALNRWGCPQNYWWPLVPYKFDLLEPSEQFFRNRDIDLVYIGNQSGPKVDRLVKLRKHFGSRFKIYGRRWAFQGLGGMTRGLMGKPVLWVRVKSLTNAERLEVCFRTKIGINMHVSDRPRETGNMRMYEVPSHGMLMVCDKAGLDAHEKIFEPDREAVFYDSMENAIEKIEYYLKHEEERIKIARGGFERVRRDYDWEINLKRFLDWASGLDKRDAFSNM